jgi:hypothetical protein
MKTIYVEDLPKRDGERKQRMYLADLCPEGYITKLTFKQWKENPCRNDTDEYTKVKFTEALIRQVDRWSLKIDYTKWVNENTPSFTQKVEWLLTTGGCLYTKRGLVN